MKSCFAEPPERRGQSSLEFAVLVGMFMIMFIIFFYVLSERMLAFQGQRDARAANDVLYKVESELNLALKVHDGYNRTFWLPLEVYGRDYSIMLAPVGDPTEIVLVYKNSTYAAPLLVNVTGDSVIVKGRNRIAKYGGNITISPIP